jgi:hypothetical protein
MPPTGPDDAWDDRGPNDRDDDFDRIRKPQRSWVENQLLNTNMVLLVLFSLCCNGLCFLPLIFGIVGLTTAKDSEAKQRAMVVTIISAIMVTIGILGNIARFALQANNPQGFR